METARHIGVRCLRLQMPRSFIPATLTCDMDEATIGRERLRWLVLASLLLLALVVTTTQGLVATVY